MFCSLYHKLHNIANVSLLILVVHSKEKFISQSKEDLIHWGQQRLLLKIGPTVCNHTTINKKSDIKFPQI